MQVNNKVHTEKQNKTGKNSWENSGGKELPTRYYNVLYYKAPEIKTA